MALNCPYEKVKENLHSNLGREMLPPSFRRCGDGGSERARDPPELTQQPKDRMRV